jgi:sugar lactone lactonase YvrE
MYAVKCVVLAAVAFMIGCGAGLTVRETGTQAQWSEPYVDGMNGAENLCFDGKGSLYVTGLDGMIYRITSTENPYRGKIIARKKLGTMCLGIEAGPGDMLYVGAADEKGARRILKVSPDFSAVSVLSDPVPGLNGFAASRTGHLYYASSNEGFFFPKGGIFRAKMGDDESFKKPESVLTGAGMVNGLAFSPDEEVLFYTETLNGLWAFNMNTAQRRKYYEPAGLLQVLDDITVDAGGTVWLCFNSAEAMLPVRGGRAGRAVRVGTMKVPSSCQFGKGKGFNPDFLYITEFGLKGRSMTMNGRGVWAVPVKEISE